MSLARQRPYGTHISSAVSALRPLVAGASRPTLLTFAAGVLIAGSATAKEKKLVGVWAYTSGSQTFLRARPAATTPPVAKVARHTKLMVWGKFDGWYRVETTDNKFGWVYHSYLNPTNAHKIVELSHKKARLASDRTADQMMYGSPQLLRAHYKRYGSEGALAGLKKTGAYVAKHSAAKTRLARVEKTRVEAPQVKLASTSVAQKPREYSAPTKVSITRAETKKNVESIKAEETARVARLAEQAENTASAELFSTSEDEARREAIRREEAKRDELRRAEIKAEEKRLAELRAENARLEKARLENLKIVQEREAAARRAAAAKAEAERLAKAARAAEVARVARLQRIEAEKKAQEARRVAALEAARQREIEKKAAAEKRRQKYLANLKARQERQKRYAAREAGRRASLRDRMNMETRNPKDVSMGVGPLSVEELMRARDSHMASSRHKTRPYTAPAPSSDNLFEKAPPGAPNRTSALPAVEKKSGFRLTSFQGSPSRNASPWAAQPLSTQEFAAQGKTCTPEYEERYATKIVQVRSSAQIRPTTQMRPSDARISRGGSPRDYALARSRNIGSGMAAQALTYRGMPYIRGAASPRRGFDCSGLIYFILRQRGYSPPRTAAGLASYGKRVAKSDLQPGDILLFSNTYKRGVSHAGVYIGNGKFVHAANSRSGVKTDSLNSGYYASKYYGARRAQ